MTLQHQRHSHKPDLLLSNSLRRCDAFIHRSFSYRVKDPPFVSGINRLNRARWRASVVLLDLAGFS